MKNKRAYYGVVLVCLLSLTPNCKLHSQDLLDRRQDRFPYTPSKIQTDPNAANIAGSVYINEEALPAKLGTQRKVDFLRYDAYSDRMEVKNGGDMYYLADLLDMPIHFTGSDKTYQLYRYREKNEIKKGYFVVVHRADELSILAKEKIDIAREVKQRSTFDKYQPPSFKRLKDRFYHVGENNLAEPLPVKKKSFIKMFSKTGRDLGKFIKENKLNIGKKEDLIRIFRYREEG